MMHRRLLLTRIRTRYKGKVKIELEVLGLRRVCQGMTSSCRLADGISLRRIDWVRADVVLPFDRVDALLAASPFSRRSAGGKCVSFRAYLKLHINVNNDSYRIEST